MYPLLTGAVSLQYVATATGAVKYVDMAVDGARSDKLAPGVQHCFLSYKSVEGSTRKAEKQLAQSRSQVRLLHNDRQQDAVTPLGQIP